MKVWRNAALGLISLWLAACSTVPGDDGFSRTQPWALLPVVNHSSAQSAAELTTQALAQVMSDAGFDVRQMPSAESQGSTNLLSSASLLAQGKAWSAQQKLPLAVSAVVDRWQLDDAERPELALTLHLLDGRSGEPLWTTEGQSTGLPGQTPEALLQPLLRQLLGSVPLVP